MDFSTVRLIAADMDGTLLNSKHELSIEFFPLFQRLKEKDILFAAASGRQYYNILKRFETIQRDMTFIAENGSLVVHKGQEIHIQAMNQELAKRQVAEARKIENVYTILCGKKQAYIDVNTPSFVEKMALYYDRFEIVDDLLKVEDDEFLKIALCDLAGSENNSYRHFRDTEGLQVKVSGEIWLDLSDPAANKGRALNILQQRTGISIEETMVFGDYLNDIEMMQEAAFSFAMENAHPEVKKVSRFTALSNDADGVIEVLKKVASA
jgi:Cof subfamily protein (haloacid dehalogenase superfamily)